VAGQLSAAAAANIRRWLTEPPFEMLRTPVPLSPTQRSKLLVHAEPFPVTVIVPCERPGNSPNVARCPKALEIVQVILESVLLRREKNMRDNDGKRIVDLPAKEVIDLNDFFMLCCADCFFRG